MLPAIIISCVLLIISILLLGIRIFFSKNGKFPDTHIGKNKAMHDRGIGCATSQDRDEQTNKKHLNTFDIIEKITEN